MTTDTDHGKVPIDGGQLYYERKGAGPALVLVHSGWLDSRMWDPQFETFSRRYTVIRYDVRGYGRSTKAGTGYRDAIDLKDVLDHIGIESAVVLGNSNGARIASEFVAGYPGRARGLVLVGGGPADLDPTPEEEASFLDTFGDRGERILTLASEGKIDEAVSAMLLAWAPQVQGEAKDYLRKIARDNCSQLVALSSGKSLNQPPGYPVAEGLRTMGIPMLSLCGEHDHPALAMMMGRFAQQVPSAKYLLVPGGDDTLNYSAPQEFDRLVFEFLDQVQAGNVGGDKRPEIDLASPKTGSASAGE